VKQDSDSEPTVRNARTAIAGVRLWYHSIEVASGVVTPGWFDLRPIVERLPWPDVRGKRCLDVGTSDGFLGFELARRGAAEVVATDIAGHEDWDWELNQRARGPQYMRTVAGPRPGLGFQVAHELLRSSVRLERIGVYDLAPERVGRFDLVVCGSLLLHLRDPFRALAAIRSVCRSEFLCANQIDLRRSVGDRGQAGLPLLRLDGTSGLIQWWVPNVAGHRQMLRAAGFTIERECRPYSIPFGPAHPARSLKPRWLLRSLARRALTGNDGVPHHAILATV